MHGVSGLFWHRGLLLRFLLFQFVFVRTELTNAETVLQVSTGLQVRD